MTRVGFHYPGEVEDGKIKYVVTAARFQNNWVFCRHKKRTSWDMPGGHREPGETLLQAARRELWEESGAEDALISPVCIYSVSKNGITSYGMLYFAQIGKLGELPPNYEMEEVLLSDHLPEQLTYPDIQPELFLWVQGWLNAQSNPGELWDVYDEDRNLTGKLHRRGEYMQPGEYHLVVHVWMLNSKGQFLLTKRAPNKGFPNMWESTGGSALAGDDSLTAALREVQEETGLVLDPGKGERILSERREDYFRDVWLFRQDFDLNDVVLLPGETTDKQYADAERIHQLLYAGEFVPYSYIEQLLELTSSRESV